MSKFAIIENNAVVNLAEAESIQIMGLVMPEAELVVEETQSTGMAYIGAEYRSAKGKFVPMQVYPSWTWNERKFAWVAPTAEPADGGPFYWDEETLSWIAVLTVTPIEPDATV